MGKGNTFQLEMLVLRLMRIKSKHLLHLSPYTSVALLWQLANITLTNVGPLEKQLPFTLRQIGKGC